MTKSVRNSIAFALTAVVLTGAPVVMAQSVHPSWYSGQSWGDPAAGGMSGGTTGYYGSTGGTMPSDMTGGGGSTGATTTTTGTAATGTNMTGANTMGSASGMDPAGRQVLTTVPADNTRERGQRPTERMQTSLLNTFSSAGYVTVRDFRKMGERYQAQAQDRYGNWSRVELDPATGTISRLQ